MKHFRRARRATATARGPVRSRAGIFSLFALLAAGCGAEAANLPGLDLPDAAADTISTGSPPDLAPPIDEASRPPPPPPPVDEDAGVDLSTIAPPEVAPPVVDAGGASPDAGAMPASLPWPAANNIVATVKPPTFPERTCPVTSHGGKGDGTTDNTAAFAAAINACTSAGGGHVDVPAGKFVTGAITLKDNIDLRLAAGATIAFSGDETKYPLVLTRYQGIELMNRSPMIYAYQARNIAVTGSGTLDGSAAAAWNLTQGTGFDDLTGWSDAATPVKDRILPTGTRLRTSFLNPYRSRDVLIEGVTVTGSQFWQVHPTLSSNVTIRDVTTNSSGPEANALVIESCDNVVVQDGTFVSGADCIAFKSGRDADGRRVNTPTKNVVVNHARCQCVGGMIAVGSEESGGVQGIYVHDLTTIGTGTNSVLFLKASPTRGGNVSGIFMDKVSVKDLRGTFFVATMTYIGVTTGNFPPMFGDVTLSNVNIDGASRVMDVRGLAGSLVGPISIADSTFANVVQPASSLVFTQPVTYARVLINGQPAM